MANTVIQLKKSATPSASPSSLANGELAINFADGKLFYKHANGTIAAISGSGGGGGDSFGTVNASGTFVVADVPGDILTFEAGSGISIVGDAINDKITISATGGAATDTVARETANVAYDRANLSFDTANQAFNKANSANVLAFNTGIGANAYATSVGAAGNTYAQTVGTAGNVISVAAFTQANLAQTIAIAAFDKANTGGGGGGGGSSITTSIVSSNTQTAVKDNRYILANTTFTTVTLPGSPTLGDTIYIIVANGLANNIIARNGNRIMGLNEDMVIDIANSAINMIYADSNLGWRIW